jgi:hypothetical protein
MSARPDAVEERHVLKDRPGRRRVTFHGSTVAGPLGPVIVAGRVRKQTDPGRTRRLLARYRALFRALVEGRDGEWAGPRAPAIVATDVASGWIEIEAFPGVALSRLPDSPARDGALLGVARALGALEQDGRAAASWPEREWSAARELEHLARLWMATGRAWPAFTVAIVRALAKDGEGPRVPAHRDLNEEQVLIDPACPTDGRRWVDWDQASWAPAGLDLGNLLAHERLRALRRGDRRAALDPSRRAGVVAAYRDAGGRARRRVVRAWEAIACLRLAALARDRAGAAAAFRNPAWVPLPPGSAVRAEGWARALEEAAACALDDRLEGAPHGP